MPSFIRLSRLTGLRAISAIIPICKNKKQHKSTVPPLKKTFHNDPHLPIIFGQTFDDNGDSGMFWEHENEPPLGSCPRCCGRPVTSHLGNPLNSRSNVFHLSIVTKHSTQNMIFICTSKGNTLPYGLSSGSTNPWYFISTSKHECGLSALFHLIHLFLEPTTYSCQDLFSMDKKVYPWGYPLECPFSHVIPTWCLPTNQLPGTIL